MSTPQTTVSSFRLQKKIKYCVQMLAVQEGQKSSSNQITNFVAGVFVNDWTDWICPTCSGSRLPMMNTTTKLTDIKQGLAKISRYFQNVLRSLQTRFGSIDQIEARLSSLYYEFGSECSVDIMNALQELHDTGDGPQKVIAKTFKSFAWPNIFLVCDHSAEHLEHGDVRVFNQLRVSHNLPQVSSEAFVLFTQDRYGYPKRLEMLQRPGGGILPLVVKDLEEEHDIPMQEVETGDGNSPPFVVEEAQEAARK